MGENKDSKYMIIEQIDETDLLYLSTVPTVEEAIGFIMQRIWLSNDMLYNNIDDYKEEIRFNYPVLKSMNSDGGFVLISDYDIHDDEKGITRHARRYFILRNNDDAIKKYDENLKKKNISIADTNVSTCITGKLL